MEDLIEACNEALYEYPSYGWVEEIIASLENRFDINDKKTQPSPR